MPSRKIDLILDTSRLARGFMAMLVAAWTAIGLLHAAQGRSLGWIAFFAGLIAAYQVGSSRPFATRHAGVWLLVCMLCLLFTLLLVGDQTLEYVRRR